MNLYSDEFILLTNIQGFSKNRNELEIIINAMRPEIICITETHVIEDMENIELNIENYNNIGMTSENRRTGGVTTYLRKDIAYKEIKNVVDNQNEKNMWICSAELKGKYEGIIVSNIYHSPNQSHEQFINRLVEEAKNRERSSNYGRRFQYKCCER